jgi:hypothetical protein
MIAISVSRQRLPPRQCRRREVCHRQPRWLEPRVSTRSAVSISERPRDFVGIRSLSCQTASNWRGWSALRIDPLNVALRL